MTLMRKKLLGWSAIAVTLGVVTGVGADPTTAGTKQGYLKLSAPTAILVEPQRWEGPISPHTLSVIELNRGGYKYWGWYGLQMGGGVGLARSNDLVHWRKFRGNPLITNARWPSVLKNADPDHPQRLYLAVTRDYDTPTSYIVLMSSDDGVHLRDVETLVKPVAKQRNQNPNLFRDPVSGRFFLTFYRGNDHDHFEIVSKSAKSVVGLAAAPERVLLRSATTVAAPTLLYLPNGSVDHKDIYYLATEVYPGRYESRNAGWQVKVFYSDSPDGKFVAVSDDPVEKGGRACLFQFVFNKKFYGYQCYLDPSTNKWGMEVVTASLR